MLRQLTARGYYLVSHPDHARLAGQFAAHWGNARFPRPHPSTQVLHGISVHDDGWLARDAHPSITREGRPSAFSIELVGRYSAFEEIILADYLAVREAAVRQLELEDPYAALLVSLHTYNLLTERADRSTIAPADLPLLDDFLNRQRLRQTALHAAIRRNPSFTPEDTAAETVFNNFRLLQACDNLSLLSCVDFGSPANLLHSFPTLEGSATSITVEPLASRTYRLDPYPFDQPELTFELPARHVEGHTFTSTEALAQAFQAAPVERLEVKLMR